MPLLRPRPRPGPWLLLAAFLVSGFAAPRLAAAGDVAPSAYASALTMPGFLLEAPWLMHLHPQLSAGMPSHVGATSANSVGAPAAIQAVLRNGNASFFAFSQSNQPLATVPITSDLVQIGAAWTIGGLRLGAAARGAVARNSQRDIYLDPGSTTSGRDTQEEHEADRIEGAFGAGLGGDATFLDLTFEATRERFETTVRDSNYQELYEVDVDGRPVTRYGGAVRMGFPGPWESRLQLAGSFSDRTADVNVEQVEPDSLRTSARRDEYGHLWRAGLTVSRDLRLSSLTFFALYTNRDGPVDYQRLFRPYRDFHQTVDLDEVVFGMSLRRGFWWDTRLLVGVQNRFELLKVREFRLWDDDQLDYDARTTEVVSRAFSWGLQRTFENLDLTGAMRTDLAAGDLFVSLDAVYRL